MSERNDSIDTIADTAERLLKLKHAWHGNMETASRAIFEERCRRIYMRCAHMLGGIERIEAQEEARAQQDPGIRLAVFHVRNVVLGLLRWQAEWKERRKEGFPDDDLDFGGGSNAGPEDDPSPSFLPGGRRTSGPVMAA